MQEELLDINNLSFILAEDLCEDPSVVIPVVTPPLQLHSTENLALPLESLDNTDQPIIINNDKDVLNKSFVSAMLSITTDPEYNEPITKVTGGRKRFKANQKKLKQLKHNCIEEKWSIECNHQESSTKMFCKVKELSDIDIVTFKKNLCNLNTKIDQDKFLLNFLSISNPNRKNRRKEENQSNTKDRLVIRYVIPSVNEGMIPVCSKSFTSITSISRRRLNLLSFKFNKNHASPKEKRGGKRINQDSIDTTESIKSHIMTYKSKKSHYTRVDTGKSYLQPGLSVKYLWKNWLKMRVDSNKKIASYSKYFRIFSQEFNLSFGHPRQDICSWCSEMAVKIKKTEDPIKKEELVKELNEHKALSKNFHKIMHETKSDTISVAFDMMQNQPLPKLSVTEVFYSRQVWLYNLTFVITSAEHQNIDNCFLYTWLESDSGRGPNEITSILIEFLTELENRLSSLENPPTNLNLFSDSCSAQNKNQYVMAALLHYINYKTIHFTEIKHYFPVRGHSYMPPDQVFGRIEKSLRNKEVIVSPNTYYEHFKKFTTVNIYDCNFKFYNYKIVVKDLIKTNFFKTTKQKVFSYKSGMKTVGVSATYTDNITRKQVLKKNVDLSKLNEVPELQRLNHVSLKKQNDVRKFMKFFTIPNEAEQFYTNIFKETTIVDDDNDNIEYNEDDV